MTEGAATASLQQPATLHPQRLGCGRASAGVALSQPATSDTPGHVVNVSGQARAQGAIVGQAMSPPDEGQGRVVVLVSLQ